MGRRDEPPRQADTRLAPDALLPDMARAEPGGGGRRVHMHLRDVHLFDDTRDAANVRGRVRLQGGLRVGRRRGHRDDHIRHGVPGGVGHLLPHGPVRHARPRPEVGEAVPRVRRGRLGRLGERVQDHGPAVREPGPAPGAGELPHGNDVDAPRVLRAGEGRVPAAHDNLRLHGGLDGHFLRRGGGVDRGRRRNRRGWVPGEENGRGRGHALENGPRWTCHELYLHEHNIPRGEEGAREDIRAAKAGQERQGRGVVV
mmetsp:Transcript_20476/g.46284  ORF Transcript_20476/g.46284 Transcript_20476/m.46284 type:complete len:256 (-) Transcript_20476:190-957(-)